MIQVYFLPSLVSADQLAGRTVVVIDVLRATTTIAAALDSGAREVLPLEHVAETRQQAEKLGPHALTGGERRGMKIEGFDLGNSPTEYTRERVAGKSICFTTTNGTRAMQVCRQAQTILLGAFVNFDSLSRRLPDDGNWDVVCAGTDGQITGEDVLLAGALVADFQAKAEQGKASPPVLNDQATLAADLWLGRKLQSLKHADLTQLLKNTSGGRNLIEIGQESDIAWAAQLNHLSVTPQLDCQTWKIIAARSSSP